jgi:hypothetical protein
MFLRIAEMKNAFAKENGLQRLAASLLQNPEFERVIISNKIVLKGS